LILTVLGFGGGVAYSLRSDNFHDFFTEYVPFGEEAVLYFEEREFRKRFPSALKLNRPRDNSTTINIPQKSGLTWKVAEEGQNGSDLATKGRHMSAVDAKVPEAASSRPAPTTAPNPPKPSAKKPASEEAPAEKAAKKVDAVKEKAKEPAPVESVANPTPAEPVAKPAPSPEPASKSPAKSARAPEVNEPSVFLPVSRIDPLSIKNAEEPLVQDLVKILNDIIAVVNADNSNGKFTSTIEKAKGELAGVGKKIIDLKATEHNAAKEEVKQSELQFDEAARELVRRLEDQMRTQESKWRDELESERKRIANDYEERVHTEIEKSNQVMQQKVQNRLLEQAVSLKKEFTASVKDRVETEREGRLARLSELSSSVEELEKLTGEWNSVIDANLKTQHLQVAVEAVKSNLERTDRPRPFIKELAALKEIAANDSVVNSAIASINPIAYQRGVPTSAQLIDRFRRVADEVRKASLLPEDAGIASHAASLLLSKVMFKKQGRAVGNDVESILTRTETLLEEGNLDDAAREMNTLQGWAKALSQDWLSEARRVLEVKQALEVRRLHIGKITLFAC
jgi:mitofilin